LVRFTELVLRPSYLIGTPENHFSQISETQIVVSMEALSGHGLPNPASFARQFSDKD
jgi:hypothetical protein